MRTFSGSGHWLCDGLKSAAGALETADLEEGGQQTSFLFAQ